MNKKPEVRLTPLANWLKLNARFSTNIFNFKPKQMYRKIILIMRLTTVLLITTMMQVSAASYGQLITLHSKNTTLLEVFKQIRVQSGYDFMFDRQLIAKASPVSISVKDASLDEVLQRCFASQSFTYTVEDKTIVVKTKEANILNKIARYFSEIEVTGNVRDENGKPLPGVTVKIKGQKTKGTFTDNSGRFKIIANEQDVLIFNLLGYQVAEQVVTAASVNVVLKERISDLDQVVVVGYGTTKRKDLTGSVASVNMKELSNIPFVSMDNALAGKASGVQVVQGDGSPGGVAKIRIRGGASLLGGNDPLYIIDGVPVNVQNRYLTTAAEVINPNEATLRNQTGNLIGTSVSGSFSRGVNSLAGININDIESIDILKDASATAIYGSKAANGVVIITTKKGKVNQKPVLEFNYYTGVSSAVKEKLLNKEEYIMVMKEAAKNANDIREEIGRVPQATATSILNDPNFFGNNDTDWLGLVLRNGVSQNADLSVRGGGLNSSYYTSLAYTNQKGVILGSDFNRVAGKINVDNEISKKLRVTTNLDYGFTRNNISNGVYAQALLAPPTIAPYNADGSVHLFTNAELGNGFSATALSNLQSPLALLDGINQGKNTSLIGALSLEYEMIKDLKFKSTVSVNHSNYHQLNYVPGTISVGSRNGLARSNGGIGTQGQTETNIIFFENTFTWNKQFNENSRLNLLAGTSFEKNRFNSFSASGQGFPDDEFLNGLSSAAIPLPPFNASGQSALLSFYLRGNYAWKDKYLATFTARSDASSKFPSNNRVGYFPSGGIAWRIAEENFLKDHKWIDELKLRASIGYTGTQNIGNNLFYTLYSPVSLGGSNGLIPTQLGNNTIKWESTLQKDLGLDFAFFKSTLSGTIGYYQKNTSGVLFNTPVGKSSGFAEVISNIANIQNRGLELDLRGQFISKANFQWSGGLNISRNRSKVLKLNNVSPDLSNPGVYTFGNTVLKIGEPLGLLYGVPLLGTLKTKEEVDAYKAVNALYKSGNSPYLSTGYGNYQLDQSGFYKRDIIGRAEPKFYGGYTNTFSYMNLSLVSLFTFSYGGDILYLRDALNKQVNNFANRGVSILDRWTPENPDSNRPRLVYLLSAVNMTPSSGDVYDASYVKLKSVTLNYQLPKSILSRLKISQCSVYVSGINLFAITNYPGADPEVSDDPYSIIGGYSDAGAYPNVRQYTMGLRLGF
ncbi:TonB-dependent receptor [Pedobacter sp. MC2016-14]|uniref:TonB-dependent receptor n=1 Tax=Pedobacter sp. MC2016-14 TaxID=2897327 RepID=UPI001E3767F2|nr:TonB-dependent receptor [Pedobacter sp. MC2016-14]MCD0490424.1 TonB-dependent receptor [Pedobacter sp. MC2016-14]